MFAVGDKVKLMTLESPEMTVAGTSGPNGVDVCCRWFAKDGSFYERNFHETELGTPEAANKAIEKAKVDREAAVKAAEKAEAEAAAEVKKAEAEARKAEKAAHSHAH